MILRAVEKLVVGLVVHRKNCSGGRDKEGRISLGAFEALFCQTGSVALNFIRSEAIERLHRSFLGLTNKLWLQLKDGSREAF